MYTRIHVIITSSVKIVHFNFPTFHKQQMVASLIRSLSLSLSIYPTQASSDPQPRRGCGEVSDVSGEDSEWCVGLQ